MICDVLLLLLCFLIFVLLITIEPYEPPKSVATEEIVEFDVKQQVQKKEEDVKQPVQKKEEVKQSAPIEKKEEAQKVIGLIGKPKAGAPIVNFIRVLDKDPYIIYSK